MNKQLVEKDEPGPFTVRIEEWDIFRAWKGDHVTRWCLVYQGSPIGPNFETREEAEHQAQAWGWPIDPTTDEEEAAHG